MPSSSRPYQSKLLRLVLQQWQQGLERQDRAWRQLQSTAVWGTQVAIFPVYAIVRAAQRASFSLGSGGNSQPNYQESVSSIPQTVTDLEHSLTAILTYTQHQLSTKQTKQLGITKTRPLPDTTQNHPITTKTTRTLPRILKRLQTWLPIRHPSSNQADRLPTLVKSTGTNLTTSNSSIQIGNTATSGLMQQGTTLASSLDTQQLVLVNLKNETFDIFTPAQQIDLQHYIDRVMYAYRQTRTLATRSQKQLSVQAVFALGGIFIAALPAEFRKAWNQIAPISQEPTLPSIRENMAQPSSRIFYPQTFSSSTVRVNARRLKTGSTTGKKRRLSSKSPHAVETKINDVSYIEHPLERILRWLENLCCTCFVS
ncbi:MAG: hypothetical protein AAFY17_15890 [Cyanobacteria bacterium J06642_11]